MNINSYPESTGPIYRPPDERGFYNPYSGHPNQALMHGDGMNGLLRGGEQFQQSQLHWNEQNCQTTVCLPNGRRPIQSDSRKNNRLCRRLAVLLLLVLISVLASCGTMLLMFRYTDMFERNSVKQLQAICVPCSKTSSNLREIIIVKKAEGGADQDCCTISSEFLDEISNRMQKDTTGDVFPFPNVSNSSIHVFLKRSDDQNRIYKGIEVTDYEKVINWTTGPASAFSRPRVQLTDTKDEIYVKDAGTYVIYGRLEFNGPPVTTDTISLTDPVWFGQRIMQKYKKEPLLEDNQVKTCISDEAGTLPCYTSQLFAVLHLPKGSRLSVQAKPINAITSNVQNSYFGLFKID